MKFSAFTKGFAVLIGTALITSPTFAQQNTAPVTSTQADNTKLNVRDKASATPTADDQSNNSADLKTAAAVRSAIVADGSLSTMAHNVKLVAMGGVVTLRGPVASEAEKTKVAKIAADVVGVVRVHNTLDIKVNN